jgi:hypothetical protein
MVTNWILPPADAAINEIAKVIALNVIATSNENVDSDSIASALSDPEKRRTIDPALDDRATEILGLVIAQFRGAIQIAGKYPLSVTAGTVPPEVYKHVLNMAAWELAMSSPSLKMFILSEAGASAPFATFYTEAKTYLEKLTKGLGIVLPTDPTGRDYLTAINVNWMGQGASPFPAYDSAKPFNFPLESIRVGASSPPSDMNTWQGYFEQAPPHGWPLGDLGFP